MIRILCLTLIACGLVALPSMAQTKAADSPLVRLDRKTDEMMKGLDENQVLQFEKIRTAHGTIRAVADVRTSLEAAVKSCAKENPDLATPMSDRLQTWKNTVLPVYRRGENRLEKMILTQSFSRPSAMRSYLKTFDDAVKYKNHEFTEVPISRADDCKKLMKNMDDSEKVMSRLIIETLGLDQDQKTEGSAAKN